MQIGEERQLGKLAMVVAVIDLRRHGLLPASSRKQPVPRPPKQRPGSNGSRNSRPRLRKPDSLAQQPHRLVGVRKNEVERNGVRSLIRQVDGSRVLLEEARAERRVAQTTASGLNLSPGEINPDRGAFGKCVGSSGDEMAGAAAKIDEGGVAAKIEPFDDQGARSGKEGDRLFGAKARDAVEAALDLSIIHVRLRLGAGSGCGRLPRMSELASRLRDGSGRPLAIAHRTAMGHAPENSLSGIRKALELGADGVEIDVQLAADGVPVLMHDASVSRTASANGYVAELTSEALHQIEIGPSDYVPMLSEALDLTAGQGLLVIELKVSASADPKALAEAVLAEVDRADAMPWVWLWSFDQRACETLREQGPADARIARLCLNPTEQVWRETTEARLDGLSIMQGFVTSEVAAACRAHGLGCFAWTVNEAERARELAEMGLTGIVGDYPERILAEVL